MNHICDFPTEIICEIISFLSFHDLIRLRMICSIIDQAGLKFLNSTTNIISAFWSYCQYHKLQWIEPRFLENLGSYNKRLYFYYHCQDSSPFIVAKSSECERFNFCNIHKQIYFSLENRVLQIECTSTRGENSFIEKYNLIKSKTTFSRSDDRLNFNGWKVIRIPCFCFKPANHHFYYRLTTDSKCYLYIIEKLPIGLLIESVKLGIRVTKSVFITKSLIKIVIFFNNKMLEVFVDFGSRKIEIGKLFRISVEIDSDEFIFIDDCVFMNQKFRAYTLNTLIPEDIRSWFKFSLIDIKK
jgi:hypothetical protein